MLFPRRTILLALNEVYMSNKAARNLFVFGSLFFFAIFIAMTVATLGKLDSRAPQISQAVDDSKMV